MTQGPAHPPATGDLCHRGKRGRMVSLSHPYYFMGEKLQSPLSHAHPVGPAYQQPSTVAFLPVHCIWLVARSPLLLSYLQTHLYYDAQARGCGQFCTALRCQHVCSMPDQTKEVHMSFGGNRTLLVQSHKPRCGPWWQQRSGL